MKKVYHILVVALMFCVAGAHAQETKSEEYVVQKADTLWGISGSRLQDPFLWPKLWNVNPHISNPDLILPGEKLIIPSREELLRQASPQAGEQSPEVKQFKAPAAKAPPVRTAGPAGETQPSVELTAEETPRKKYLIDKDSYVSAGWITDVVPGIGKIISTPSGHEIAGKHDVVYLNIFPEKALSGPDLQRKPVLIISQADNSKSRFFSIRDVKEVFHPVTGKTLGHLVRVTGVLEIIGKDNDTPKAGILRAFDDVQVGDGLIPYKEMEPPLAPDVVRTPAIKGHIVESLSTAELSSKGAIIFLDRGQNDGLLSGDVLSVFSSTQVSRVIGKIQIITLQPTTAGAVILSNEEAIEPGMKVGQR
ncbi:MAG: LysM peptidoglycan-binding domain-containing protein [Nitrospirae bacterium]|nr:LysM peptidoglycan-binding domain-containing protein [Nitrospirota bacterium]